VQVTFGSLFAGIGGMDLGLERAGLECRWQVEIDDYCRRVLAKHWPDVPKHDDVKTFPPQGTQPEDWHVDLIAGGFPCQDTSNAGKRAGIDGARSGLWSEFKRIIRLLRPRLVLVENTPGLLSRGLGRVLGDLAEIGYDAEWDCLPAAALGAPHLRDRVFILAYPDGQRPAMRRASSIAPSQGDGGQNQRRRRGGDPGQKRLGGAGQIAAVLPHPESRCARQLRRIESTEGSKEAWGLPWAEGESRIPRVADGVPARMDRLERIGNAVVPQVAEFIGRRLMEAANP
jgi:DNA (cytosine-5)-methyltransferase 1